MSGMSTHGGDVTVNINGLGASADTASRIDIIIWPDVLAELNDGSVSTSY